MWVMISGIIQSEDAFKAYNLGADALGLVVGRQVHASENGFLSLKEARSITKSISSICEGSPSSSISAQQEHQNHSYFSLTHGSNSLPNSHERMESICGSVLVTHLTDMQEIILLATISRVITIQLAGNATPEDIADIKYSLPYVKVIKSVPVVDESCMEYVQRYIHVADAIELDTLDIATQQFGGTGKTHNWDISKIVVQEYERRVPIILAGGLHSDNIEEAIQTVKPTGVDVSSGVKRSKGVLDDKKLESLIYKAKNFIC